jgi:hypothetical protein
MATIAMTLAAHSSNISNTILHFVSQIAGTHSAIDTQATSEPATGLQQN